MSAPTSGIFGDGEKIGAALSRERERPRYYDYSPASNKLKFVHTSVALGATFRLPLRVRSIFLNARERLILRTDDGAEAPAARQRGAIDATCCGDDRHPSPTEIEAPTVTIASPPRMKPSMAVARLIRRREMVELGKMKQSCEIAAVIERVFMCAVDTLIE